VGNRLTISVEFEHETRMEHIVPASAPHPVTQVGYAAVYLKLCEEKLNTIEMIIYICMCAEN
jgi:hypothetical protein